MKSKISLLLLALLVIGIRWTLIGSIQNERFSPIEIDDAYSYLMKAEMIFQDPFYQKATLKSFEHFGYPPKLVTMPDVYQMRINHRINHHYHLGHSIVLLLIKLASGIAYQKLWWLLVYAINFFLIVVSIYFFYTVFGSQVAHGVLVLTSLNFMLVNHQLTAAPREWSVVAAFGLLLLVWKTISTERKNFFPAPLEWLLLTFAFWFCLSAHDVGKAMFLQISAIALITVLVAKPIGKTKQLFFQILTSSSAAYLMQKILLYIFQPARGSASMSTFSTAREPSELFWSLADSLAGPILLIKNIRYLSQAAGISLLLIGLLFMAHAAWKRKEAKEIFGFLLVSSTVAIQVLFHFVGYPYLDGKILFLESYYFTFSFAVFSFASAYGLLNLGKSLGFIKWEALFPVACWMVFLLPLPLKLDNLIGLKKTFVTQNNWVDGSEIAKTIDSIANGKCVYMEGEVALSVYLMYGNYQTPISYNGFCREPSKFLNKPDWDCDLVFMGRSKEPCKTEISLDIIGQNANYIFARINK